MKRLILPSALLVLGGVLVILVTFAPSGVADEPVSTHQTVDPENPGSGVVAYYFHGNVRCRTCRTIEQLANETITANFSAELASGQLRWSALNVDEPDNEHFVEDFKLVTRSLVLVSYQDGKVLRFQTLDRVWQLVRDEEMFADYVRDSTRNFLTGG